MSHEKLFEDAKEKTRVKLMNRKSEIDASLIPFKTNSEYDLLIDNSLFITESSKKSYKARLKFLRKHTGEELTHNILIDPYKFGMFIIDSNTEMKSKDNKSVKRLIKKISLFTYQKLSLLPVLGFSRRC